MTSVVIADDELLVRDGLCAILELAGIEIVALAATGAEAVRAVRDRTPDVVLMDIGMPEMDGIEATRRVARMGSPARVLILTTFDADRMVYDAMCAGASGFLLKDAGRAAVVAGVRTVAAGEQLLAPAIARRLIERFVRRPPAAIARPPALAELSGRELEVLRLIARGLSNDEIAAELVIGRTTVKTHVAQVLAKCGLRDRVQAVVLAYESGLVVAGEEPA
jgi:DNA-binding NarL/FixJ family response regulator